MARWSRSPRTLVTTLAGIALLGIVTWTLASPVPQATPVDPSGAQGESPSSPEEGLPPPFTVPADAFSISTLPDLSGMKMPPPNLFPPERVLCDHIAWIAVGQIVDLHTTTTPPVPGWGDIPRTVALVNRTYHLKGNVPELWTWAEPGGLYEGVGYISVDGARRLRIGESYLVLAFEGPGVSAINGDVKFRYAFELPPGGESPVGAEQLRMLYGEHCGSAKSILPDDSLTGQIRHKLPIDFDEWCAHL